MNKEQANNYFGIAFMNTEMVETDVKLNNSTSVEQADGLRKNIIGMVLDGKYTVLSYMDISTGEADLYMCTDGKEDYVAKVYRRKEAFDVEVTKRLQTIDSPFVAKVYSTGEVNGFLYEIIPYYKMGCLAGKKFSYYQLKSTIIPALNEGLHVLHNNGIIHRDLKPSNIMLADNGQDAVIIDYGISSIREFGKTTVKVATGMTLVYSSPEAIRGLYLNESDYYSLGITLYELYCGQNPYTKMSPAEIEQFVVDQKLPLPTEMEDELKDLITALTYQDIRNRKDKANPNRRWGYGEVLKWCSGIAQPVPGK